MDESIVVMQRGEGVRGTRGWGRWWGGVGGAEGGQGGGGGCKSAAEPAVFSNTHNYTTKFFCLAG